MSYCLPPLEGPSLQPEGYQLDHVWSGGCLQCVWSWSTGQRSPTVYQFDMPTKSPFGIDRDQPPGNRRLPTWRSPFDLLLFLAPQSCSSPSDRSPALTRHTSTSTLGINYGVLVQPEAPRGMVRAVRWPLESPFTTHGGPLPPAGPASRQRRASTPSAPSPRSPAGRVDALLPRRARRLSPPTARGARH